MHTSNTIAFILYLAPVPTVQIIHPDCDFKAMSTFHSSLLRNKHGDPRFFSQLFAKNSLIKNIFEEEKKFDIRTLFFGGEIVSYFVHLGQSEGFKLTTELSKKVQYPYNRESKTN